MSGKQAKARRRAERDAVQNDINVHGDLDKIPGQEVRRHTSTGHAQLPPLPPAPGAALTGWSSLIVTDTSLSRQTPPEFEVLTKVVDRVKHPVTSGPEFGEYESIRAIAEDTGSIVIGFDTEFTALNALSGVAGVQTRTLDSYQFAVIHPLDPSKLMIAVILPEARSCGTRPGARISLERALEVVIEVFALHEHPLAPEIWNEKGVSRSVATLEGVFKPSLLFRSSKKDGVTSAVLPITLLGHYQHADLTAFADRRLIAESRGQRVADRAGFKGRRAAWLDGRAPDILRTVISASGGMVTPQPVRMVLNGSSRRFCRPIELSIRDSLALAPAEGKRLANLGDSIGQKKLDVPDDFISRMSEFREKHLEEFLDYGAQDAVITLEYASALFGDHRALPLTLSTAAARAIRETIKRVELLSSTKAFNLVFAGLVQSDSTAEAIVGIEEQLDYYKKRDLSPCDGAAATWQHSCANSLRGGYNACMEIGYFGSPTHDYDLISCYPTSESVFYDLDFTHPDGVILNTVNNVRLTLKMLPSPLTPFVGFVRFKFPQDVQYPTIPVPVEGSMVFPRSSGAGRGVWASGPELYLALQLGAEVFVQIGHFGRVRVDQKGEPTQMLREANRQLIIDREAAKQQFGKKSLEQSLLKNFANSGFGKLAQGVMGQRGWDAWAQSREAVGGSAITSPYHGMMTTAVTRAVLLAVLNQLDNLGYKTPSCTTDGFITDAPHDLVESLELYGFAELWKEARESLTGDSTMWEEKHHQNDLLNITTRANFSLEPGGVLAHGGYKLPKNIEEDSAEDRQHMHRLLVSREGAIPCSYLQFPSVQELTRIENRWDFQAVRVHKQMSIEFDRKRRPIAEGMTADFLTVDGVQHEIAHVDTVPWETPEEAVLGRSVDAGLKKWDPELGEEVWTRSPVRKTVDQWLDYFTRLDVLLDSTGAISNNARLDRIAKSIVIAQRQGVIDIPWLNSGTGNGPLKWRLELMTMFGLPPVSERFWHHAKSDQERQIDIDLDGIAPFVGRMITTEAAYFLDPEDLDPDYPSDEEIAEIERIEAERAISA